jgi:hypothetical protein
VKIFYDFLRFQLCLVVAFFRKRPRVLIFATGEGSFFEAGWIRLIAVAPRQGEMDAQDQGDQIRRIFAGLGDC